MAKSRLTTIFLIVFVDILGFGLILPLLPYYAETYGATAWITGLLVASYAAAQLIGAPLLGRLSDRFGRRPVLLLSILGTAVGFLILALAEPIGAALGNIFGAAAAVNGFIIAIMFFSRILDGVTGGNISVAQAYITDVTDSESRAKGLGLLGGQFVGAAFQGEDLLGLACSEVGLLARVFRDVEQFGALGQGRAPDELPVALADAGAEGLDVVDHFGARRGLALGNGGPDIEAVERLAAGG